MNTYGDILSMLPVDENEVSHTEKEIIDYLFDEMSNSDHEDEDTGEETRSLPEQLVEHPKPSSQLIDKLKLPVIIALSMLVLSIGPVYKILKYVAGNKDGYKLVVIQTAIVCAIVFVAQSYLV